MKKLINDPATVVPDALAGLAAAHPDLVRVTDDDGQTSPYVTRARPPDQPKTAVVSGGGSGHEPLHSGFVGLGMLDAACPGPVFTSPTPDQVLAATRAANLGRGVLHIVKNYTGDVLNFETAAELAAAEGIEVASVVIDDDVAVEDSTHTAGRRGVGGTVLAEKIVGAAAERGDDLTTLVELATLVNQNVRSMGMALTSCTVPHVGRPTFELGEQEMEIGIGIHGEPGRERLPAASATEIVDRLLTPITRDLPFEQGSRALLFVNGMGGTPLMELYLTYGLAETWLSERGIRVERSLVGNYITSLEMQGASITLLRLDDELVRLWDAPVHTAGLRWGV